jgi:hypothetical protein
LANGLLVERRSKTALQRNLSKDICKPLQLSLRDDCQDSTNPESIAQASLQPSEMYWLCFTNEVEMKKQALRIFACFASWREIPFSLHSFSFPAKKQTPNHRPVFSTSKFATPLMFFNEKRICFVNSEG